MGYSTKTPLHECAKPQSILEYTAVTKGGGGGCGGVSCVMLICFE